MHQEKQSYQIYIKLSKTTSLSIGKLGVFRFPAGKYIYTGRAKKNIHARVNRHISKIKKVKWHIDYLLACKHATILQILLSAEDECQLNLKTKGEIIIPRFGASDCKNKCGSHLKYIGL